MKENEKYLDDDEDGKKDSFPDLYNSKISLNLKEDYLDIDIRAENKIFDEIEENKKIEKIVCPDCGIIPNLVIESQNYTVKSNCPRCQNNTIKTYKLVNYIEKSNAKIPIFIKCDGCNKTNKDLKIEKNEMFICSCGKIFCEDCKEKHEEINDSKNSHEFISYSEKDYQCCCKGYFSDYSSFCVTCNENLCANCQIEHDAKNQGHKILFFTEEIGAHLTKDIIEKKKKKFEEKSNKIKEFLEELDEWKEEFESKINHLKHSLKLLMKVNNYILYSFDKSNLNQQIIETLKNLDFSYNILIDEFIKVKDKNNSFESRYQYLLGLFNYQKNSNMNLKLKKFTKKIDLEDINTLKYNSLIIEGKVEEEVTAVCQFGKGFAIGDIKGQIHFFNIDTNSKKLIKTTMYDKLNLAINYLCSLNDNYFISSNKEEIKIIKLDDSKGALQYNIIKTFKYNDEERISNVIKDSEEILDLSFQNKIPKKGLIKNNNIEQVLSAGRAPTLVPSSFKSIEKLSNNTKKYYQVIKLLNDNIVYLNEDKIMRLEPAFNNNYNRHCIKMQTKLICMVEINENKFCVYSENNSINIFDSNNFKKIKDFSVGNSDNILCTKIQMIDRGTMAGIGKDKIYLISLNKFCIVQTINTERTITDMVITKSNKILISEYYKKNNYLIQYNYKVLKDEISLAKNDMIEFGKRINLLYLLDNKDNNRENPYGRLLCIFNDKSIHIYETNKNNKNNNIKK